MDVSIRELQNTEKDRHAIGEIFNYFVRESFAAYTEEEIGKTFAGKLMNDVIVCYIMEVDNTIMGFGYLKPYLPYSTFKHSAALTYFLLPEFTGKGLGTQMLTHLMEAARSRNITHLLAHISSKNQQSLGFHKKHGFEECGRLEGIGVKFDQPFDVVWVQKVLKD